MASSGRLKPGEKGEITATVATAGRMGNLVKNVRVTSNDPERSVVDLTLSVNVALPSAPPQPSAPSNSVSAVPSAPTVQKQ